MGLIQSYDGVNGTKTPPSNKLHLLLFFPESPATASHFGLAKPPQSHEPIPFDRSINQSLYTHTDTDRHRETHRYAPILLVLCLWREFKHDMNTCLYRKKYNLLNTVSEDHFPCTRNIQSLLWPYKITYSSLILPFLFKSSCYFLCLKFKMSFLLLSLFMTPFHLTAPTQISYPSSYVPSSKKPFLHVITSLCANMDLEHNSTMQHLYHTAICLHAHPSY